MNRAGCGIQAYGAFTALGDGAESAAALVAGKSALQLHPVLGSAGGDCVPLALLPELIADWKNPPPVTPAWTAPLHTLLRRIPEAPWGRAEFPVFVTGSNFGIDSLLAYHQDKNPERLSFILPERIVTWIREQTGWGRNVSILSHACVSASLGLAEAEKCLTDSVVEQALVVSFDFISPFVAGGFHALKILNESLPAPFAERDFGSIALGDGAAFVVLGREKSNFHLAGHTAYNEMYHFTSNDPAGSGFEAVASAIKPLAQGRKFWVKGHGTGTLEAGRLEAESCALHFPGAPLVSWKGAIGHTLGSCGAVELVLALEMMQSDRIAGTHASAGLPCPAQVETNAFDASDYDAVLLQSNAFGGAHATTLIFCE